METIVGKCIDGKTFQKIYQKFFWHIDEMFPGAKGIELHDLVEAMLPGQKECGLSHIDFENRTIGFAAITIYEGWQGTDRISHKRILYATPEIEQIILQEWGNELFEKVLQQHEWDSQYTKMAKKIWKEISRPGTDLADILLKNFFYNDSYSREENNKRESKFTEEIIRKIAEVLIEGEE